MHSCKFSFFHLSPPFFLQSIGTKAAKFAKFIAVLIIGLIIMSFGVGLSIRADLGTSPVSSIPYVLNIITGMSVGTTTIIVNVIIVLLQIVLLRKKFRLLQLLQLPVCIAFGLLCDVALACMPGVIPQNYWQQWLICAAGIVLVGIIAKTLNRFIVPLGKKFFLPRQKQSDITQDNNKNEDKKEA